MQKIIKKIFLLTVLMLAMSHVHAGIALGVCNSAITANAPDERYSINGDGTVTDLWTGLMWKQCVEGQSGASCNTGTNSTFTWSAALTLVDTVNGSGGFATHTNWRLPNIKELLSLVEFKCAAPARNKVAFPFNGASDYSYWSSSPTAIVAGNEVFYLDDETGFFSETTITSNLLVRLVRDTQ